MIYLIGGPARCGKSTLAKRFRREMDGQVISGDSFIKSLLETLQPEWVPDIFVHTANPIEGLSDDEAKLARVRRRDLGMWPFYTNYLEEAAAIHHDSVLLEGDLWPDSLISLKIPHRAVFLVDTSDPKEQALRLRAIRDSTNSDNNWMSKWTDERLQQWAHFNLLRSQLYITLYEKHGNVYFDIANGGIQSAQDAAFEYLLSKKGYNSSTT